MTAKPQRVLLLEDNPADADLIRALLAKSSDSIELVLVERLAAAIQRLGEGKFDVVISDLNVPDSEGLDTFLRLHAKYPEVPIVVLTGMDDQSAAGQAVRQGAQDYLVKGAASATQILSSLRYAVERQQMLNDVIAGLSRREKIESALRKCGTAHLWGAMFAVLGEGAIPVLYKAGQAAGQTSFDFLQAAYTPSDDAAFVKALTEHFGLAGLFMVEEMTIDRPGRRLDARLRGSFEAEVPRRSRDRPSCHFLCGLLAGIAGQLLQSPDLGGKETTCEQTGADACTFVVTAML